MTTPYARQFWREWFQASGMNAVVNLGVRDMTVVWLDPTAESKIVFSDWLTVAGDRFRELATTADEANKAMKAFAAIWENSDAHT